MDCKGIIRVRNGLKWIQMDWNRQARLLLHLQNRQVKSNETPPPGRANDGAALQLHRMTIDTSEAISWPFTGPIPASSASFRLVVVSIQDNNSNNNNKKVSRRRQRPRVSMSNIWSNQPEWNQIDGNRSWRAMGIQHRPANQNQHHCN